VQYEHRIQMRACGDIQRKIVESDGLQLIHLPGGDTWRNAFLWS